jgi:hypothetical protein
MTKAASLSAALTPAAPPSGCVGGNAARESCRREAVRPIEELREAIAAVLGAPSDGSPVILNGRTARYAASRIAWHVLEHSWEMQDRAES